MMRMLVVLSAFCFSVSVAQAQYNSDANADLAAARATVKEIRTKDVTTAAKPLNNKIDYIAGAYDAGELRALIKNYEKTNKKIAARQGKAYIPYDRKIDVNNPQKVKRYFRNRVDIVF